MEHHRGLLLFSPEQHLPPVPPVTLLPLTRRKFYGTPCSEKWSRATAREPYVKRTSALQMSSSYGTNG